MAKLLSVVLVFFLIAIPVQGTSARDSSGDSLRVRASGAGRLFLGGNLVEGPWTLSYETGRLTVNGYGIAPPKPAPQRKLSAAEMEQHAFLNRMDEAFESAGRSPQGMQRFVAFCDSNSKWVTIERESTLVLARLWDGNRVAFSFQPLPTYGAPGASHRSLPGQRESLEDSRLFHLRMIARHLERGGIVFLDDVGEIYPNDPACVLSAISQLRTGAPLDSAALHCLPRVVQDQLKKPKDLARYIAR